MLCVGAIEAEVEVAHEEVDVGEGVRFDLVPLGKEADVTQDFVRHCQSLVDFRLTRLQVAVHKGKGSVVERELDHHSALPAIAQQVFYAQILRHISHEDAIKLLDEDSQEDFAFANKVDAGVPVRAFADVVVN